jgi:hypothetical protein
VPLAAEALEVSAAVCVVSEGIDGCAAAAEGAGREVAEGQAEKASHRELQFRR